MLKFKRLSLLDRRELGSWLSSCDLCSVSKPAGLAQPTGLDTDLAEEHRQILRAVGELRSHARLDQRHLQHVK